MVYKISIVIPVFNVEDYLDRALESLRNQTIGFENLEIIFVDDCSTDNSYSIIKNFAEKYDNVFSFCLDKNSGVAGKPRNKGIENATADYLMFLDPDDIFTNYACELLYDEITKENIDVVSGVHTKDGINVYPSLWLNTITNPDESYVERMNKVNKIDSDRNFNFMVDSIDDCPAISANFGLWTKIFKKSFIDENNIRFPEYIPAEDSTFLWNVFLNAKGIKFINQFIVEYTVDNNSSVSHQISKKRMIDRLDGYYQMLYLAEEKNKVKIFVHYLLLNKLNYFLKEHLLLSDCSTSDLLDVLIHSQHLFKVLYDNKSELKIEMAPLFKFIASRDYESALNFIYEHNKSNLDYKIQKQRDIKVASIMDSFTYNSYKYEFNMVYLYPDNWLEIFEIEKPDIFLCESAFNGISNDKFPNGAWLNKVLTNLNNDIENRQVLIDILQYCKENNIPSVFYNKEDPPSFDDPIFNFVDIALHFDYIFTSAEECIPRYYEMGHENVYPLMFAAQTRLFNPIKTSNRLKNTVMFAGSWYKKFPKRCELMSLIFDKILDEGLNLKIYDRFSELNSEKMTYPEKYQNYIHPGVEFSQMPEVYKESDYGLNINTVTNSNTMFARRIFELMASNTIVFSNFSKGIYSLFGENVFYLDESADINLKDYDLNRIREENLYNVLENHSYANRFKEILDKINYKYIPEIRHIILFYFNVNNVDKIYEHFNSINYPYKHLIIISDDNTNNNDIISVSDLDKFDFKDSNYFFSFVNFDMSSEFINKALLHYSYIYIGFGIYSYGDQDQYCFGTSNQIENVIFNSLNFAKVKEYYTRNINQEFILYYI